MSTPPSPPPPPPGPPDGLPPGPPGPPGPYGAPPPPPGRRPGISRTALFWIGVAVGVVGAPVLVIAALLLLANVSTSSGSYTALQVLVVVVPVALIAAGLVVRRTRWLVLGALAGGSVVLIVLGGACVALISSLSGP